MKPCPRCSLLERLAEKESKLSELVTKQAEQLADQLKESVSETNAWRSYALKLENAGNDLALSSADDRESKGVWWDTIENRP